MKDIYHNQVSEPFEPDSEDKWNYNRRKWFKLAIVGIAATQIPWYLSSCESNPTDSVENETIDFEDNEFFTKEEMQSLHAIQNVLIPNDGNGPSAHQVNAHNYFIWMLRNGTAKDQAYFEENLKKLLEISTDKFKKEFHLLNPSDKYKFIENNVESGWTRSFLSRMITVIFEAMLLDPIYNVNPNEIGWEWLEYSPSQPQPTENLKYPSILKKLELYV